MGFELVALRRSAGCAQHAGSQATLGGDLNIDRIVAGFLEGCQ